MDISLYRFNLASLKLEGPLSLRSGQRSLKSWEPLKTRKGGKKTPWSEFPSLPSLFLLHAQCSMKGKHCFMWPARAASCILPSTDLLLQLPQLTLMANNIILCFSLHSLYLNSSMNPYYPPPCPQPSVLNSRLLCSRSSPSFSPHQTCSVNGLNRLLVQPVNLLIP